MKKVEKRVDDLLSLFEEDKHTKTIKNVENLRELFKEASSSHNKLMLNSFVENLEKIAVSYEKLLHIMTKTYQEKYNLTKKNLEIILKVKHVDVLPLLEFEEISKEEIEFLFVNLLKEIEFDEKLDTKEFIKKLKNLPDSLLELKVNLKALNSPMLLNIHNLSLELHHNRLEIERILLLKIKFQQLDRLYFLGVILKFMFERKLFMISKSKKLENSTLKLFEDSTKYNPSDIGFEGILSPQFLSNYFQSISLLKDIQNWHLPKFQNVLTQLNTTSDDSTQNKVKEISLNMEGFIKNDEIKSFINDHLKYESPELLRKSLILTLFKMKNTKKNQKKVEAKLDESIQKVSKIVMDSIQSYSVNDEKDLFEFKLSTIKSIGLWKSLKYAKKNFLKQLDKLPDRYHEKLAEFLECEMTNSGIFSSSKRFENLMNSINMSLEETCLLILQRKDFHISVSKFSQNFEFWCSKARKFSFFPELTEEEVEEEDYTYLVSLFCEYLKDFLPKHKHKICNKIQEISKKIFYPEYINRKEFEEYNHFTRKMFDDSVNQMLKEIRKKPKENIFIALIGEIKFLQDFIAQLLVAPSKSIIQKIIKQSKDVYDGKIEKPKFEYLVEKEIEKRKKKQKRKDIPTEKVEKKADEKVEEIKDSTEMLVETKPDIKKIGKILMPLPYTIEEIKSKFTKETVLDVEQNFKFSNDFQNQMYQRIYQYRNEKESQENEKKIKEVKLFLKQKLNENPLTQKEINRRKYWESVNE
eukprot:gene2410-2874_t